MERFDHVIVGGGVIGASVAYHLATEGAGPVLLLERNELASAASSKAAGLLLQATAKPAKTPLARHTRETIPRLEAALGKTVGFHAVGSLRFAASAARVAELESMAADAADHGIPVEWLSAAEATALAPWLDPASAQKIAFFPTDGYVDPYLLTMAYARVARGRGVDIRPRTAVTDVLVEGGKIVGVCTAAGKIACESVIDAAGAWAALLSARAGYPLPMAPVRSHYWITGTELGVSKKSPVAVLPDAAAYMRPDLGGLLLGVQEPFSAAFDARDLPDAADAFSPTAGEEHWDILAEAAAALEPFYPAMMETRFANYVCGLSSYTPDGGILLGPVPAVQGFLAAAGCCGSGVTLSAGIGAALAALALGREAPFDISAFRPDRFGPVDPFSAAFRARCAAARAAKSRR